MVLADDAQFARGTASNTGDGVVVVSVVIELVGVVIIAQRATKSEQQSLKIGLAKAQRHEGKLLNPHPLHALDSGPPGDVVETVVVEVAAVQCAGSALPPIMTQ